MRGGQGGARKQGLVVTGTHTPPFPGLPEVSQPCWPLELLWGDPPEPPVTTVFMDITPGSSLFFLFNYYCQLTYSTLKVTSECMPAIHARLPRGFGV